MKPAVLPDKPPVPAKEAPRGEPVDRGGAASRGVLGMVLGWLVRLGLFIAHRVPLRVSYGIMHGVVKTFVFFVPRSRKIVADNLRGVFGDLPKDELDRMVTENMHYAWARRHVDMVAVPHFDKAWADRHIEVEGLEKFQAALAEGRGVLLASCHVGSPFVIFLSYLPHMGVDLVGAMRRIFNEKTSRKLRDCIETWGAKVYDSDFAYPELMKCLARGGVGVTMADHPTSPKGIRVPFFGRDTFMPAGPPVIAFRSRCVLMPCYCVRASDTDYRVVFGDAVDVPPTPEKIEEHHIRAVAEQYIPFFEDGIRKYHAQWETYIPNWPKSFSEEDLYEFIRSFGVVYDPPWETKAKK